MALHSISGNFTVTYNNGVLPNIDNDGGSIRHAGTIGAADTTLWNSMRLGDDAPENNYTLALSGIGGAQEINRQGVFNGGTQVIRLVTTGLAGVANTTLRTIGSNAENRANTPLPLRSMRVLANKTAIRDNSWDEFNATWAAGTPQNAQSGIYNQNTNANESTPGVANLVDDAANPSRAVPGEFVFLIGKTITSGTYDAKNG